MKRLDQGHLHPLLEHPETNKSRAVKRTRVACVAGVHSSKELFEQLILLLLGTFTYVYRKLYSTVDFFYYLVNKRVRDYNQYFIQ
jgi:hypothetical protein